MKISHEINLNPQLPKNMHQIKTFLLIGSDLMWTLYGFLKNLPDKNATVDSFVDYSIGYYHTELIRLLKNLRVNMNIFKIDNFSI